MAGQHKHIFRTKRRGFTIVELLIVIVVIAILAAIVIVAYQGIQQRARDSIRANDMQTLKTALLRYNSDNGGVKATYNYGGNSPSGWNLSPGPNWLTFLGTGYGKIPMDPVNNGAGDPYGAHGLEYFYYCYSQGSGPNPATPNVRMGYLSEATGSNAYTDFPVDQCL